MIVNVTEPSERQTSVRVRRDDFNKLRRVQLLREERASRKVSLTDLMAEAIVLLERSEDSFRGILELGRAQKRADG